MQWNRGKRKASCQREQGQKAVWLRQLIYGEKLPEITWALSDHFSSSWDVPSHLIVDLHSAYTLGGILMSSRICPSGDIKFTVLQDKTNLRLSGLGKIHIDKVLVGDTGGGHVGFSLDLLAPDQVGVGGRLESGRSR